MEAKRPRPADPGIAVACPLENPRPPIEICRRRQPRIARFCRCQARDLVLDKPRLSQLNSWLFSSQMKRTVLEERRRRDILTVVKRVHERVDFRFPPFRFEDFLAAHDTYKVFEVDLPLGLDGSIVLTPDGERRTIYLRKDNPRPRVRFTLAHEIMHAELHFMGGQLDRLTACRTSEHYRDGRRNILEREADLGAAELLMPLWMIDRYLPYRIKRGYADQVVKDMARLFRVSETAMRIQLKQYSADITALGEIPAP